MDMSGGRWRELHFTSVKDWPPVNPQLEKRKYIYTDIEGRIWLSKFAGLGRYGEEKFKRAKVLDRYGLVPSIRFLKYGFLWGYRTLALFLLQRMMLRWIE